MTATRTDISPSARITAVVIRINCIELHGPIAGRHTVDAQLEQAAFAGKSGALSSIAAILGAKFRSLLTAITVNNYASFKAFDIAGSGMSAQSVRLNTTASNLANADSVGSDPRTVYKARHPVFEAVRASLSLSKDQPGAAVKVSNIVESNSPPTARYEPGNPLADANGYVYAPNVNAVEEW